jgi:hypothetical protein
VSAEPELGTALAGRRVLVVEDELLVALEVEAALLDVNLRGEMVTPIARLPADRELPFMLVTGYDRLLASVPVT